MRPEVLAATTASSLSIRPLTSIISSGVDGPRRKNHQADVPPSNVSKRTARIIFFTLLFPGLLLLVIVSLLKNSFQFSALSSQLSAVSFQLSVVWLSPITKN